MCALEAPSTMLKKKKSTCFYIQYWRTWVGSIPYFFTINRVKLGLGTVMLFCVQTGVVEFLVMKRTFALRYTARRPKVGREAIQTMQEGNTISRSC